MKYALSVNNKGWWTLRLVVEPQIENYDIRKGETVDIYIEDEDIGENLTLVYYSFRTVQLYGTGGDVEVRHGDDTLKPYFR